MTEGTGLLLLSAVDTPEHQEMLWETPELPEVWWTKTHLSPWSWAFKIRRADGIESISLVDGQVCCRADETQGVALDGCRVSLDDFQVFQRPLFVRTKPGTSVVPISCLVPCWRWCGPSAQVGDAGWGAPVGDTARQNSLSVVHPIGCTAFLGLMYIKRLSFVTFPVLPVCGGECCAFNIPPWCHQVCFFSGWTGSYNLIVKLHLPPANPVSQGRISHSWWRGSSISGSHHCSNTGVSDRDKSRGNSYPPGNYSLQFDNWPHDGIVSDGRIAGSCGSLQLPFLSMESSSSTGLTLVPSSCFPRDSLLKSLGGSLPALEIARQLILLHQVITCHAAVANEERTKRLPWLCLEEEHKGRKSAPRSNSPSPLPCHLGFGNRFNLQLSFPGSVRIFQWLSFSLLLSGWLFQNSLALAFIYRGWKQLAPGAQNGNWFTATVYDLENVNFLSPRVYKLVLIPMRLYTILINQFPRSSASVGN